MTSYMPQDSSQSKEKGIQSDKLMSTINDDNTGLTHDHSTFVHEL